MLEQQSTRVVLFDSIGGDAVGAVLSAVIMKQTELCFS